MVLKGISLKMQRGQSLAIMGPSGSGKSTLLHLLGTLDRPTSGRLLLDGRDPMQLSDQDLAAFRNRVIGFIFQDHHLLPQCSVLENVLLPTIVAQHKPPDIMDQARRLLDQVGLSHRLQHRPAALSGGERQRVAVARALINQPLLVLADEPTGNLDQSSAQSVGQLLLNLCPHYNTILIAVTHSAAFAEQFPRRMQMVDGVLLEHA